MESLLAERALMEEAAQCAPRANLPKTLRFGLSAVGVTVIARASSNNPEAFSLAAVFDSVPPFFTTRRRANR